MKPADKTQSLEITSREQQQLFAFVRALTGSDVYTNKKWSDPFDKNGKQVLMDEDSNG